MLWLIFAKIGVPQAVKLFEEFQWYDYLGLANKQISIPLWFLHDLIIIVLASPIIYFFIKKLGVVFLVLTGTYLLLSTGKGTQFLGGVGVFWFSLGAFLALNKIDLLKSIKQLDKWLLLILWVAAAILKTNEIISGKAIDLMIISIGIATAFSWCNYFFKSWNVPAIISYLSSASMFFFCIHMPINQFAARQIFKIALTTDLIPHNHFTIIALEIFQFLFLYLSSLAVYAVLKKALPKVCAILSGGR